ncbi:MAG: hypothetical protein C0611_05505 [Desulfobacteraceae bacterium]|nr:MAG: hypothetical protein C0611_05505 [Desulfobacteraceae bacterium]
MFTMAVNLVGGGGNRHSPINIKTRIIVHSDLRNKKRGLMLKVLGRNSKNIMQNTDYVPLNFPFQKSHSPTLRKSGF